MPKSYTHHIEIVDDLMVVLDEDGNGYDSCVLTTPAEAKDQLRLWQEEHNFDYVEALTRLMPAHPEIDLYKKYLPMLPDYWPWSDA